VRGGIRSCGGKRSTKLQTSVWSNVSPGCVSNAPDLVSEDALFVRTFGKRTINNSASEVYRMTHSEMPWREDPR